MLTHVLALIMMFALSGPAFSADRNAKQVTQALVRATVASPAEFSGLNLGGLDLAGLDFKGAKLAGADLTGADLTGASLVAADLAGAKLDRATIVRVDFSKAKLQAATLLSAAISSSLAPVAGDAPNFESAVLTGASLSGQFEGSRFRKADLSGIIVLRPPAVWGSYQARSVLSGADFSGANLAAAKLPNTVLRFADFSGASLAGADLSGADLTQANLSGADVRDTDFSGADFDGAKLSGVVNFAQAKGLRTARNLPPNLR